MSLFVDSLRVAGVMGIAKSLSLDLRSSLTLIYAPNGTGKTSVWKAAEALLSSQLHSGMLCKAPASEACRIHAEISIDGSRFDASVADGQALVLSSKKQKLDGRHALQLLAPECRLDGLELRGGGALRRLSQHISATRFLPADSLLYLIDDNADALQLRRQLFADLTGTSTLQVERREVAAYAARLSKQYSEESTSLAKRSADLARLQQDLPAPAEHLGPALRELLVDFGVDAHATQSIDVMAAGLTVPLEKRRAVAKQKQEYLNAWKDIQARFPDLKNALAAAVEASGATSKRVDELSALLARQTARHAEVEKEQNRRRRRAVKASEAYQAINSVISLRQLLGPAAPDGFDRADVANVYSRQMLTSELSALKKIIDGFDTWQAALAEQSAGTSEANRAQASLEGLDRSTLVETLATVKAELADEQRRAKSLVEARRVLLSAALGVVKHGDESCPCCAHEWPSRESLQRAIEVNIQLVGADEGHTSERELALRLRMNDVEAQLEKVTAAEDALRRALQRVSSSDATLRPYVTLANGLAIDLAAESLASLSVRRDVRRLALFRVEAEEGLGDLGMEDWSDWQTAAERVANELESLGSEIDSAEGQLLELREASNTSELQLKRLKDDARELTEKLANFRAAETKRQELARQLDLERVGMTDPISHWSQYLADEFRRFDAADSVLAQVSTEIRRAAASEALDRLKREVEAAGIRVKRMEAELSRARELEAFLSHEELGSATEFFERLGPAVGTLFNHMQVNRVFAQISLEVAQESFALAGKLPSGASLGPGADFSQGQKQDLALAMFLVRACSLGGTFFLDEPLVHLDDLNRTALLDCFRACVIGTNRTSKPVRLVVTTASWSVARLFIQKFSSIEGGLAPPLRVYQLAGNVEGGTTASEVYPHASEDMTVQ